MKQYIDEVGQSIWPWFLAHGLKILVVFLLALILDRVSKRLIERTVRATIISDNLSFTGTETKRENTLIRIFSGVSKIGIWIVTALMVLQEMGVMIGPILAGAGIAGLAVGFGGQYLIRDIISGLFIILENQYRIGDVVNFDGTGGLVEDISLRMTTIRDLDGTVHHIPHGEIKKVSNLSKYFSRVNLNVGISYNSNLEHVIATVNQVGNELANDAAWKDFILQPPQFLRIDDFGNSSLVIKILGETQPIKQWDVTGELRKRIKIAFDKEGIEIPFPQRVVHFYKDNIEGENENVR
jgi:small conductance mechanosensitive channel